MKKAHYQIHKNEKGFYFLLVAANNEKVGGSMNEYYDTKAGCKRGITDHHGTVLMCGKSITKDVVEALQTPSAHKDLLKELRIVDKTK